jgi:hypothetical protein
MTDIFVWSDGSKMSEAEIKAARKILGELRSNPRTRKTWIFQDAVKRLEGAKK